MDDRSRSPDPDPGGGIGDDVRSERCGPVARASEPLPGTAPEARTWLLVEDHGPWGRDALADGTLPGAAVAHLAEATADHGVRYQAIRRPDRTRRPTRAVLLANLVDGWLARLDAPVEDLVDLDVAAVTRPEPPPSAEVVTTPLVAVCTHGRRDACCAQWGRPLVAALAEIGGEAVWETSHTGGHRFAPSILSFPSGAVHGFVDDAAAFWDRVGDGGLDLATYRGNARWPQPAQAAEVAVRRHHDLAHPDDVPDVAVTIDTTDPDHATAHVTRRGTDALVVDQVALRRRHLPDAPVSCGARPVARATWVVAT